MVYNGGASANTARSDFKTAFEDELRRGTGASEIVDSIRYNATVYYREIGTDKVKTYQLGDSGTDESWPKGSEISRQPAISTGRLVMVEAGGQDRIFRVEVRLWRD